MSRFSYLQPTNTQWDKPEHSAHYQNDLTNITYFIALLFPLVFSMQSILWLYNWMVAFSFFFFFNSDNLCKNWTKWFFFILFFFKKHGFTCKLASWNIVMVLEQRKKDRVDFPLCFHEAIISKHIWAQPDHDHLTLVHSSDLWLRHNLWINEVHVHYLAYLKTAFFLHFECGQDYKCLDSIHTQVHIIMTHLFQKNTGLQKNRTAHQALTPIL